MRLDPQQQFDAVVIGAGTSGSAAAYFLAREGLRCALVDERTFDSAGARWVNSVPGWMFDRARLERPTPPELRSDDRPCTMRPAGGCARITIEDNPAQSIDMRLLVERLHSLGMAEGVTWFEQAKLQEVELDNGRLRRIQLDLPGNGEDAQDVTLAAGLFADASGTTGALRCRVPAVGGSCPPLSRDDICSAAQEVCKVRDRDGAEEFLKRNHVSPGETICTAGVYGGFSVATVCVERDFKNVDLLAGVIADGCWPSGPKIISEIKERETWIGDRVSGGSGAIPIRRPYDRIAASGIALLGDAACQVFPAHASGTGVGLIAAQILAESVTRFTDPGSEDATFTYQVNAQRELGSVLASYDLFRRFSQRLRAEDIESLLSAGLINKVGYSAGLEQRIPRFKFGDYIQLLLAATRKPALSLRMLPELAKMPLVRFAYRRYPANPTPRRIRLWSHIVAWLIGGDPDCA